MLHSLRAIAYALGGEVSGGQVLAPGPGHRPHDRSMSVRLSSAAPDGFVINSFAGDDWRTCRDHVRAKLGIAREIRSVAERPQRPEINLAEQAAKARRLWRKRQPVEVSVAERYLRQARAYRGPIPATLGFLPPSADYPPTLIAAFGMASEPEPGVVAIADAAVRGVHVTRLLPDGSDRISKATIGRGSVGAPIALFPPNDLLGLAIVEGIEDGLSIHAATGLGVWVAGTAGRMPALADAIPDYADCVTVFGHDDPAGRKGAGELTTRLRARGVEALLKFLSEAAHGQG